MRKSLILLLIVLTGCTLGTPDRETEEESLVTETIASEPTATQTPLVTRTSMPTSLPIPTGEPATAVPPPTEIPAAPVLEPVQSGEQAYALRTDGAVRGDGLNLLGVSIWHFAQNPANSNRYAVIDAAGMLYITGPGGAGAFRIEQSPYSQFPATTREDNNAAAEQAAWSPNGQYVAFIVNGDKQAADGVWYFEPGTFAPLQLLVDCPGQGFVGCNIVQSPDNISLWESRELYWSPDSQRILVNVNLPERERRGLIVLPISRDERVRDRRPAAQLYDYGTWGSDGRILASGSNPDGIVVVAWLNADGSLNQQVYNATVNGLWMGWAAQQPDGDIVALGRPGEPNGPVALYDMNGVALTDMIGDGFPQRVIWSPDHSAVLVVVNGRQYVASVDGSVSEITSQTGGLAVNWVR